jgi:ubiquinone/menaquinone biosynthesis C-methylase UbiE
LRIRNLLKRLLFNRIFAFNPVMRDHWIARQAASIPKGARLLDVGAGSCPYRSLFAHCEYSSQDFAALDDSQLRHGGYGAIDYVCDAAAIPVANASFDAILCTEMLEHVPQPEAVVAECARILRPGGKLMLTAPLGSGIHQEPHHYFGGFTPYWYQRVLKQSGFQDIQIVANGGSFKCFAQESIRFVMMTRPFAILPAPVSLLWLPLWIVLVPILAGVIPLACHGLDRYDREKRFSVGYQVTATRAATEADR